VTHNDSLHPPKLLEIIFEGDFESLLRFGDFVLLLVFSRTPHLRLLCWPEIMTRALAPGGCHTFLQLRKGWFCFVGVNSFAKPPPLAGENYKGI
jgi:hypothetical protein